LTTICFLVASLEPGGTENYLLRFLEYADTSIESVVISKSGKLGVLYPKYKNLKNVSIIPLKTGYLNIFSWIRIYLIYKKKHIDTVCDLTSNFGGIYLFLAKIAGIKKRVSFYRQSSNHFKESFLRLLYNKLVNRLVFKYATRILFNSKTAISFFFPYSKKKDSRFEIILNGLETNLYLKQYNVVNIKQKIGIPEDSFIIGHTGRFNEAKNHKTILTVAEKLCNKHDDIYFVLCGRDTDSEELTSLISKKGLKNRIIQLGYRADIPKILKSFDLFYFPSITEGQPNSLIEAMVSGIPVVASDIEPVKDSVPEFIYSYLTPPLEDEQAIKLIERLYKTKDFAIFSKAQTWAIKKYDHKIRFKQFLDILIS